MFPASRAFRSIYRLSVAERGLGQPDTSPGRRPARPRQRGFSSSSQTPRDRRYRISQEVSVKMSARNTAAQMAVNPAVNHGPHQWRELGSRTDPPPNVLAAAIDTAQQGTTVPSAAAIA